MQGFREGFCLLFLMIAVVPAFAVTLGTSKDGKYFTIDKEPTFLCGISYYAGNSVEDPEHVKKDLDDMVKDGLNWIRVWAIWNSVSAVTPDGAIREPYMSRLKTLIEESNKRGIIVDVTLTRGNKSSPSNLAQHLACAKTIATELKPYRNIYIDIANERDVGDARHVTYSEMGTIIDAIKSIDSDRICTASGVPGSQANLDEYFSVGHCDFIAPHLCRDKECPAKTLGTVTEFISWMNNLKHRVPVNLQEPFRRDYSEYQPIQEDYYRDAGGGKIAGAAGWCLHNGSSRSSKDKRPQRSFSMSKEHGRLYAQLDSVEMDVSNNIIEQIGGTSINTLRWQAEYPEQLPHHIGRKDGLAWSVEPVKDSAGYLNTGPSISSIPGGKHAVTWRLMIDNNNSDKQEVLNLEIMAGEKTLAQKAIKRQDFKTINQWQDFTISFTSDDNIPLDFRTKWNGNSAIKLDYVSIEIDKDALK